MNDSWWFSDPRRPLLVRALDGPPDVEIVGGGVTGCSAALALARAGRRVRLHEARELSGGASGRNGGFALRGGAMAYDVAREWLGAQQAAAFWRATEAAIDRMAAIDRDALRREGSLRLAADAEERDELRREHDALRGDCFAVEWRDEVPASLDGRFQAAMFHPSDGLVHPVRFVRRLAALAAAAGAEIREYDRVESLDDVEADVVLVATDGYPSGLLGSLEGLIIPTRGQMIATEPLPEQLFPIPHYGRHGFDYWHQNDEGRLIAGGFRDVDMTSEFTAHEETTAPIQHALDQFAADVVGWPVQVTHRWAGIFGFVPDLMPVVGRVPGDDRLWVAGGYSGHGNVLGFLGGELVAGAILGEPDPLLAQFEPSRLLA
jgi:glycine/D-amino acid oxidase-like deaminating enzyme